MQKLLNHFRGFFDFVGLPRKTKRCWSTAKSFANIAFNWSSENSGFGLDLSLESYGRIQAHGAPKKDDRAPQKQGLALAADSKEKSQDAGNQEIKNSTSAEEIFAKLVDGTMQSLHNQQGRVLWGATRLIRKVNIFRLEVMLVEGGTLGKRFDDLRTQQLSAYHQLSDPENELSQIDQELLWAIAHGEIALKSKYDYIFEHQHLDDDPFGDCVIGKCKVQLQKQLEAGSKAISDAPLIPKTSVRSSAVGGLRMILYSGKPKIDANGETNRDEKKDDIWLASLAGMEPFDSRLVAGMIRLGRVLSQGNIYNYFQSDEFKALGFKDKDLRDPYYEPLSNGGLNYQGARYYAPWLGRWTAGDSSGLVDGLNLDGTLPNNPGRFVDPGETESKATNEEFNATPSNKLIGNLEDNELIKQFKGQTDQEVLDIVNGATGKFKDRAQKAAKIAGRSLSSASDADTGEMVFDEDTIIGTAPIELQFDIIVRRFAPFHDFGLGFDGDAESRGISDSGIFFEDGGDGYSTDEKATSRTWGRVMVRGSTINMSTGANISKHPIFFPVVGTDRSHVKADLNVQRYGDDRAHIQFSTAGDMPLTLANGNFGPPFAPDIDTHVELTYFKCGDELHLSGRVFGDTFPNAEIFLTDSLGNSVLLGGHTTAGGEMLGPFMYLWGSGKDDTGEFIKFDTHISLDAKGRFLENR